ncbi:MAG: hypothetical protein E4G74_00270 [Erysipelotrichales bacterium]|nr:MAG: hypothetical protein E4G74_00270 [Erysipelotrichales bacterium]
MNDAEELVFRESLIPIADQVREAWISAIVLRVKVDLLLARQHGAEVEDFPEVIEQSIEGAAEILRLALDELGQVSLGKLISSGEWK